MGMPQAADIEEMVGHRDMRCKGCPQQPLCSAFQHKREAPSKPNIGHFCECSSAPTSSPLDPEAVVPTIPIQYDVTIIGAGAVGCALARALSMYHLKVLVVEKSHDVGQGASKANSGIVHGGFDERHGTIKSKVSRRGNLMLKQLNKELNFGLKETGSLVLAFDEPDEKILQELMENGRKNGVDDLHILHREQLLALEPHLNPHVRVGLRCPSAAITSPYEYVIALAENSIQNGVEYRLSHEVLDIQKLLTSQEASRIGKRGGFFIRTTNESESISTDFLINCAGINADKIAAMIGANNFAIQPRKGEYIMLDRSQGHMAKHILFPVPSKKGKGILVSPTLHGNLLLGPTSRGLSEAPLTTREIAEQILSSARHLVPGFEAEHAFTSYSGLRAKSDRMDFIIEESPLVCGFINVAGIDSPGLTSSPAVAEMVVGILRDTGLKMQLNPSFNPLRKPIMIPKGLHFDGAIDADKPERNIICRCERVTEAEIIDSIHRPIQAITTDMVKRRTRAGMGSCQGGFCEIRVATVIAREKGIPIESVGRHVAGSSILLHRRLTDQDRDMLVKISPNLPDIVVEMDKQQNSHHQKAKL